MVAGTPSPPEIRAGLIARYRESNRRYHELAPRRGVAYREFDAAASDLFEATAEIGTFNAAHRDQRIMPNDCAAP